VSTLGSLPPGRIQLDPTVPQPPFATSIGLPTEFFLLDTAPGSWKRSADVLIREAFAGDRLSTANWRSAFRVLENLVVNCQRGGAALSLIRMGRLPDGQLASAGIHLAWARERFPASLGRVRDMLPRSGVSTEVGTGVGPALLHRSRRNAQVPGRALIVSMARIQLFVPFPGTHWTAIMSTASAHPELTGALDRLMLSIAGTVDRAESAAALSPGIQSESILGATGRITQRFISAVEGGRPDGPADGDDR
jgi:hypothetical protein